MRDRVAVVTGAGHGIGKAIARSFVEKGLRVTIADVDKEAGNEAAQELARLGDVLYVPTDVADEGQVRAMVAETMGRWGHIDFLVNNAGIAHAHGPAVTELSLERWNAILSVNLTGMFLCAKHTAPHLKAAQGAIVNIASTRAFMSEPNTEAYTASKGGVVSLSHGLAISLGPEVRVNCISPGWIDITASKKDPASKKTEHTPEDHSQHPVGRIGQPEDVATLALFLISPESSFITGANFIVDGGMTRKMIYV